MAEWVCNPHGTRVEQEDEPKGTCPEADRSPCSWEKVPTAALLRRWADCPECAEFYDENREAVIHAAASVGIEHGLTTNQALAIYMRQKHEHDHIGDMS